MKRILELHLKRKWFEQIRDGQKTEEFRLVTPYWAKRLLEREYHEVHLLDGYPKADQSERRIVRKWNGFKIRVIKHPEFASKEVVVFAIDVSELLTREQQQDYGKIETSPEKDTKPNGGTGYGGGCAKETREAADRAGSLQSEQAAATGAGKRRRLGVAARSCPECRDAVQPVGAGNSQQSGQAGTWS